MHDRIRWSWVGTGGLLALAVLGALLAALTGFAPLVRPAAVQAAPADDITGLTFTHPLTALVGVSASFAATVTGGTNISYSWNFDDGGTGSDITATHAYAAPGVYTVTVTATNDTDSESVQGRIYVGDVAVEVRDNVFVSQHVTIDPGDTVLWVLTGSAPHSVTADDGSFERPEGVGWPPFGHTFTTAGPYAYHCSVHGSAGPGGGVPGTGMVGTVQVGPVESEQDLYLPNVPRS
jgi:plastocyanin